MKTSGAAAASAMGPARSAQAAVLLVGISVLVFLLWEPHVEGRNAHATLFEIYFKDPFLAYVYLSSTPFFIAVTHAFKALGEVSRSGAFSQETVKSLRTIKRCALALVALVALGEVFILFMESDDRVGGLVMGALLSGAAAVAAFAAAKLERKAADGLARGVG